MKKLIIAISILFASFNSFSQVSTYYAYFVKTGDWNSYSEKWMYDDGNKCNIRIDVLSNYVRIYDKAQSNYTTYGDSEKINGDGFEATRWSAVDEEKRNVELSIIDYYIDKHLVIMIRYKSTVFAYYVTRANSYNQ